MRKNIIERRKDLRNSFGISLGCFLFHSLLRVMMFYFILFVLFLRFVDFPLLSYLQNCLLFLCSLLLYTKILSTTWYDRHAVFSPLLPFCSFSVWCVFCVSSDFVLFSPLLFRAISHLLLWLTIFDCLACFLPFYPKE